MFAALVFAAGCQMKEFSSTPLYSGNEVTFIGAVEDRINLWPLAYWREPVGSVVWPIISWGDDHLALRPVWSQYRLDTNETYDEFNLFSPIGQFDTKNHDYRFFPVFWGSDDKGENPYFSLFPALWWNKKFAGVFPFFWSRGGEQSDFYAIPLFWSEANKSGGGGNALFPLYSYKWRPKAETSGSSSSSEFYALWYLAGYERRDDEWLNHYFLPFYVWNREDFYSLPYSRFDTGDRIQNRILFGLSGYDVETSGVYRASWTFPLYYHNRARDILVTPLYGKSRDSEWLFPVYYHDESRIDTLVFSYRNDAHKGTRGWASFPLLSMTWETNSNRVAWETLAGFAGCSTDTDGSCGSAWLFPLFSYEAERSFLSLPYSWKTWECGQSEMSQTQTNRVFAAGLAGLRSGAAEGGWLFPLYSKRTPAGFEEKLALLDAERLPEEIEVWTEIETNEVWNSTTKTYENVVGPELRTTEFWMDDERTFFLLCDDDRKVRGWVPFHETNYVMKASHEIGNRLLFRREEERRVEFDTATREKVADREKGWHGFLWFIYQHDWETDKIEGTSKRCHNILWKLWDWEKENGDVALDVFPGFTYDSKTNGYVKTSLLWRLFRYERDPLKGETKVDLLFLPVWR